MDKREKQIDNSIAKYKQNQWHLSGRFELIAWSAERLAATVFTGKYDRKETDTIVKDTTNP